MHIYHGVTWGPLVREIVSAATGRNIREILATEILDPLGFRWTNYGVAEADVPLVAPSHVTGKPLPAPIAAAMKSALGGSMQQIIPFSNIPMFLTSVVPSSSTVSTAEELSRFAEMLCRGGELDGVRVMRPDTLRAATRECRRLRPDVATGLMPIRWGTGYMLGSKRFGPFGRDAACRVRSHRADQYRDLGRPVTRPGGRAGQQRQTGPASRSRALHRRCWTGSTPRFRAGELSAGRRSRLAWPHG